MRRMPSSSPTPPSAPWAPPWLLTSWNPASFPSRTAWKGRSHLPSTFLIAQSDLSIKNEVVIPIDHYLVAPPGVSADSVEVIYSHPQALAQCRAYLGEHFPTRPP